MASIVRKKRIQFFLTKNLANTIHSKNDFVLAGNAAKMIAGFKQRGSYKFTPMDRTIRKGWKTIHSVLGNSLARPNSGDPQLLAWCNFQWKLVVGKDLVPITQVKKLTAKTLFVAVSDKIWFSALETLREKIITEINKRAGSILVKRIVFQEGPYHEE